jgi:hypothetical protein
MKSVCFGVACLFAVSVASPALAVSKFKTQFGKVYAGDEANEEFKALVKKASCNVCHVKGEKKKEVRNPYGQALHKAIEEAEFPVKDFEKDPEKYEKQLVAIFEKVAQEKTGDEKFKTFADRMKANLLPGGNVEGKED